MICGLSFPKALFFKVNRQFFIFSCVVSPGKPSLTASLKYLRSSVIKFKEHFFERNRFCAVLELLRHSKSIA